jgi:hypothetical protein
MEKITRIVFLVNKNGMKFIKNLYNSVKAVLASKNTISDILMHVTHPVKFLFHREMTFCRKPVKKAEKASSWNFHSNFAKIKTLRLRSAEPMNINLHIDGVKSSLRARTQ